MDSSSLCNQCGWPIGNPVYAVTLKVQAGIVSRTQTVERMVCKSCKERLDYLTVREVTQRGEL